MSTASTCSRVNIDKIVVDGRYQRPLEDKRVAKIIENFDPRQVGALELSLRKNGTYAVIDGQHRLAALKAVGRKTAQALVHKDLTVKEEADLFSKINMGRKALSAVQRFRAQVFSGDPQAKDIQRIMTECGFKFAEGSRTAQLGDVKAVSSVERIYKTFGPDHLLFTLQVIRDCWFGEHSATDAHMLGGMALFLMEFQDRFNDAHRDRLDRTPAKVIVRRAHERAFSNSAFTVPCIVSDELRKVTGLRQTHSRRNQPLTFLNAHIQLNEVPDPGSELEDPALILA